jgi:hypothetical protein
MEEPRKENPMTTSEGPQAVPSVNEASGTTKPRVIPTNQLVILRESELDCDLTTAIERVREDESTSGSRILIVGPAESSEPQEVDLEDLPLPRLPMSIGQVARCGGSQALKSTGERLAAKIESLDCLLREANHAIHELEEATQDRVLHGGVDHVRVVRDVISWIQANTEDLQQEIAGLAKGFEVVELGELLRDVQGQAESFFPEIRVNSAPALGVECWGQASTLTEALFLAIIITAHRISGNGSVNIEAERIGESTAIRIFGLGEPVQVHAAQQMRRLKTIIVDHHQGRIVPDSMGPFGAGLVLELRSQP